MDTQMDRWMSRQAERQQADRQTDTEIHAVKEMDGWTDGRAGRHVDR